MKRISYITILCCALLFMFSAKTDAKTVSLGFNIGAVISAELSTVKLEIVDREKFPYPNKYNRQSLVVVTLKMYPRRSLSPLDYDLKINGATAKCLAAACNMEPFVCDLNGVPLHPENNDYVRMIFAFDGNKVKSPGKGKTLRATLLCNLKNRSKVTFNVTDIGNGNFTETTKIPAAGSLK